MPQPGKLTLDPGSTSRPRRKGGIRQWRAQADGAPLLGPAMHSVATLRVSSHVAAFYEARWPSPEVLGRPYWGALAAAGGHDPGDLRGLLAVWALQARQLLSSGNALDMHAVRPESALRLSAGALAPKDSPACTLSRRFWHLAGRAVRMNVRRAASAGVC